MIRDVGTNDYEGFVPPDDNWMPQRFTTMLSKDDFHAFIRRREPFIISYSDVGLMEDALGWNTAQWRHPSTGTQYLIDKVSQIYYTLSKVFKYHHHHHHTTLTSSYFRSQCSTVL